MGVDFYSCNYCRDTFCDCGEYKECITCGTKWCSMKCSNEEGLVNATCKLGLDIDKEGYLCDIEDKCIKVKDGNEKYIDCSGCKNYIPTSCSFCRKENYDDSILLKYSLKLLNISREDLINKYNS